MAVEHTYSSEAAGDLLLVLSSSVLTALQCLLLFALSFRVRDYKVSGCVLQRPFCLKEPLGVCVLRSWLTVEYLLPDPKGQVGVSRLTVAVPYPASRQLCLEQG